MNKNISFATIMLLTFLLAASVHATDCTVTNCGPAGTASGDTEFINTSQAYIAATPRVATGSSDVDIDFMSKLVNVSVNAAFCFNKAYITPTSLEYFNPHNDSIPANYSCNGTFNYTLSPNHFWCYDNASNLIFDHDFLTGNLSAKTAYWNDVAFSNWSSVPGTFTKINSTFDGKDACYYKQDILLTAGQIYTARVHLTVPIKPLGEEWRYADYDAKYGVAFWPSSYGNDYRAAINNSVFFYLDPQVLQATGGTITSVAYNTTVNWTVHTFTSNGTFSVTSCTNCTVQVLVVAGGGAGGQTYGGGGGAGGLIYNGSYPVVAGQNYTVIVGTGGAGADPTVSIPSGNGTNSAFGTLVAQGGGGGGVSTGQVGFNGGSGGGGGYSTSAGNGNSSPSQGNNGGSGNGPGNYCPGGGGGAGAAGANAAGGACGAGGIGVSYNLTGTPTYYAGGGGAAGSSTYGSSPGAGGTGGGGAGANNNADATSGTANTGGGGGGAVGGDGSSHAGNGGSGIVIVRYLNITIPGTVNETDGRTAILNGVGLSTINASYSVVYDRQVYIRIANGSQYKGTFDLFVSSGNKRWAFNFDQYNTTSFPNFVNITPVFYVWQKANMTAAAITNDVTAFVNSTV